MIEGGRLPARSIVALGAGGYPVLGELSTMDFLVAILALRGCGFKVHMDERGLHVRRFVAIDAGSRAMRSQQRKCGLAVVELCQVLPGFGGVARLAS